MTVEIFHELRRATERSDIRNGFRPRSSSFLLAAADDERRKLYSATNVKRADAFGRMKFVSRDAEQIDRQIF